MTFEDVKKIRENPNAECCDIKELQNLISIAIEKQIPKSPIDINSAYDGDYGYCPCCKSLIADYTSYKRCKDCGQALDWSDTNES